MDLTKVFTSTDGGRLAYRVAVDGDRQLVAVRIDGSTLKVAQTAGTASGLASVTVTATNEQGDSATVVFKVSIASPESRLACGLLPLLVAADGQAGGRTTPGTVSRNGSVLVVQGQVTTISAAANGVCTATVDLGATDICAGGTLSLGCEENNPSTADRIYCTARFALANEHPVRVEAVDSGDGEVCRVERMEMLP